MYTATPSTAIRIMVQSLKSGKSKELFRGYSARYLATGHLIYKFRTPDMPL
jgi:hypothetical protein